MTEKPLQVPRGFFVDGIIPTIADGDFASGVNAAPNDVQVLAIFFRVLDENPGLPDKAKPALQFINGMQPLFRRKLFVSAGI
jgi:hypothetical protein